MRDIDKTKQQLINEFVEMRQRLTELEASETQRKQAEEALRRERETLFSILQKAPYGVVLVSKDGRYLYINPEFTNITGYTLEDTPTGKDWFHKAYPDPEYRHKVIKSWKEDMVQRGISEIFSVVCHNGEVKEIEFRPTLLDDGSALVMLSDITERERMEKALEESEEKYRTLFTESRDALFITTRDGKLIDANQSFLNLFGYTTEEALGMDVRKTYVNPDDRLGYQREMEQKGAVRDYELKLQKKDGTELDCLLTATIRQTKDGDILGYHGFIRDITQRKRTEKALQESEEKYRTTLENTGTAMIIIEEDTTISLANHQSEILSGYSKHEIEGKKSWTEFVHQEDLEKMKEYHRQRRESGEEAPSQYEFRLVDREGNIKNIFLTIDIIPGTKKSVASLNDITELVRLQEELRAMSLTDELTDLYNRRGFLILAQQQVKVAHRTKREMFLLYTDVDGLKAINDTLGHHGGDQALLETANILQKTFRKSDIIARIGGDEFVVLMTTETNGSSAKAVAARFQHKLKVCNAKENRSYKLSLSIGMARYDPDNPCSVEELLNRADALMYEHKKRLKG